MHIAYYYNYYSIYKTLYVLQLFTFAKKTYQQLFCFHSQLVYTFPHSPCSAVYQSRTQAVVYETVSDVVTTTGPDTSENVAYGVSQSPSTTHNPAYGHITPNK